MKNFITIFIMLSLFACTIMAQSIKTPKTKKEKISYSLGFNIGKSMKMQGLDVDQKLLIQGNDDNVSTGDDGENASKTKSRRRKE